MDIFLPTFFLIFGAIVGSFLNVVTDRLPKGQSILYPPSHCEHCRHRLTWYDLIPIFSYLFLRGKCRYCRKTISFYYPFVEICTGLLFLIAYVFLYPFNLLYLLYIVVITSILITIFFADYKYGLIPFPTIVAGCTVIILYFLINWDPELFKIHILSSLGSFLFFLFLFVITRGRGMGFGDVMLVLFMGLFLGFPYIIIALYLSFVIGALVSVFLILIGSKKLRHDTIPFGPFLVTGTFIAFYMGEYVIGFIMPYITV